MWFNRMGGVFGNPEALNLNNPITGKAGATFASQVEMVLSALYEQYGFRLAISAAVYVH